MTPASIEFDKKYAVYKSKVDGFISAGLPDYAADGQKTLSEAMRYGTTPGGKRLRGVLALATCDLLGGDMDAMLPLAGAIEYIHAYSLIHDDMPCMDDDDYRRGKPSCHIAYGEGMAMLAGDALLNLAFETLLGWAAGGEQGINSIGAASCVASASGAGGMAGGQAIDLSGNVSCENEIDMLHSLKTGRLIKAAVLSPAICLGAGGCDLAALDRYASAIGLAFQIKDDLLDFEGDEAPAGGEKTNYAVLLGAGRAVDKLHGCCSEAEGALAGFGGGADFLRGIVSYISDRRN